MENNTTITTIREAVAAAIEDQICEALRNRHEMHCHRLYVSRSGELWWSEEENSNNYLAECGDNGLFPVPYLAQVGTGSHRCNCDWCEGENAVSSTSEIEFEGGEVDEMRTMMERRLEAIEAGYFNDEAADVE